MTYILKSDNRGSTPLEVPTIDAAKALLRNIFETDAALEGHATIDPELLAQIDALTDNESGVELHGYGMTQTFIHNPAAI